MDEIGMRRVVECTTFQPFLPSRIIQGAIAQRRVLMDQTAANLATLTNLVNILWLLIAGFLVFFMQAGFALVETGFTRAKNVAHTMMMNMMVFSIGAIGYWICGFAFQFGAVNHIYPEVGGKTAWAFSPITLGAWGDSLSTGLRLGDQIGVLGLSGFFLNGV